MALHDAERREATSRIDMAERARPAGQPEPTVVSAAGAASRGRRRRSHRWRGRRRSAAVEAALARPRRGQSPRRRRRRSGLTLPHRQAVQAGSRPSPPPAVAKGGGSGLVRPSRRAGALCLLAVTALCVGRLLAPSPGTTTATASRRRRSRLGCRAGGATKRWSRRGRGRSGGGRAELSSPGRVPPRAIEQEVSYFILGGATAPPTSGSKATLRRSEGRDEQGGDVGGNQDESGTSGPDRRESTRIAPPAAITRPPIKAGAGHARGQLTYGRATPSLRSGPDDRSHPDCRPRRP